MMSPDVTSPGTTSSIRGVDPSTPPAGSGDDKDAGAEQTAVRRRIQPSRRFAYGTVLAFSIGPDSLEMAASRQRGTRSYVTDLRKVYFTREQATSEEREHFLGDNIRQFTEQHGGRRPNINLSVHGAQTVFRMIDMPPLAGRRLRAAVYYEAKTCIPFPIDECIWDYRVISRMTRGTERSLQVAVLAVTRESVEQQLSLFDSLGLTVRNIYSAYDSVGHLLNGLPGHDSSEDTALIDVERHGTHISYYRGCELQFYHVASVGSSSLSGHAGSREFAEFSDSLAREIQNSLDYYSGQYSGRFGNQVYVQGDLAYADDLVSMLKDQFGLEFRVFPYDRLPDVKYASSEVAEAVPVCLNALSAVTCSVKLANLLPERIVVRRRHKRHNLLAAAVLLLVAASAGALSENQYGRIATERARLAALQSQISDFENTDIFNVYRESQQQLIQKTADFTKLKPVQSHAGLALKELTRLTPESVTLSQLRYQPRLEGRNLSLYGTVASTTTPPEVLLADWVERLNQSPVFDSVHVDRHVKRSIADGFDLDFILTLRGDS